VYLFPPALTHDLVSLSIEMTAVIGLRMLQIVTNDPKAKAEAQLMISEKIMALSTAQTRYAIDVMTGQAHNAPARTVAFYRKKVRANRVRLTRS
jgi:hypothetical protein